MPKILDYPRSSIHRSLTIAEAVDQLGGSCTTEMCAQQMGRATSGSFIATLSAAVKYGFVVKQKDKISLTEMYREYKLAYSEEDRIKVLRQAFLSPPLFQRIYERFRGKLLPVEIFAKLLAKEFGLNMKAAPQTARFFIQGATAVQLLDSDNRVSDLGGLNAEVPGEFPPSDNGQSQNDGKTDERGGQFDHPVPEGVYSLQIRGPGVKSTILITEEEDFAILDAMISKIRRRVRETIDKENMQADTD